MEYEICYLIGEAKEADLEKIRKDVEGIVTKNKGTLLDGEFVKKRRLAYEIKREARGTYVAKRFTLPEKDERDEKYLGEDFINEMTKELNFNKDLLRFIIVKADELTSFEELEESEKVASEERRGGREGGKREVKKPIRNATLIVAGGESSAREEKVAAPAPVKEKVKEETVIKEDSSDTEVGKVEEKKEEVPKTEVKEKEEKEEEKKEEKKPARNAVPTVADGDDISEDNIDEKLDEILNI